MRSGLPIDHDTPDSPDYRRQFTWAMHHRTLEIAPAIAAQISLAGSTTLLDLGGGPGTYAMAFLAKHPLLRATVCDREAALEVAKEIAGTHKVRRRTLLSPARFLQRTHPWYLRCDLVFECAAHLFARREPGYFSPSLGCIEAGGPIHHPRRVSARSRRFVSGRSKFVCCVDAVVHAKGEIPIPHRKRRDG